MDHDAALLRAEARAAEAAVGGAGEAVRALLAVADTPALLAVLLVLTGLLFAPATVVASTLLDTAAPPGTVTEAFAVMVMAIVAGTAVGNALGGAIVDGASLDAAALTAGAIAVLGAGWALARRHTLAVA